MQTALFKRIYFERVGVFKRKRIIIILLYHHRHSTISYKNKQDFYNDSIFFEGKYIKIIFR